MSKLHIFTFSPVQGFIENSRKLRDLFVSSLLISKLTEKLIEHIKTQGEVIYPIDPVEGLSRGVANYNNRVVFIAERDMCDELKEEFFDYLRFIGRQVLGSLGVEQQIASIALEQLVNYFVPFCVCKDFINKERWLEQLGINKEEHKLKDLNDYACTYDLAERELGILKTFRPYKGEVFSHTHEGKYPDGCTLCGERPHLPMDWDKLRQKIRYQLEDHERLCGVCLIKRFLYLYPELEKRAFPSVSDIAGLKFKEKLKEAFEKEENKHMYRRLIDILYTIGKPKDLTDYSMDYFVPEEVKRLKEEAPEEDKSLFEKLLNTLEEIYERKILKRPKNNYFAIVLSDGDKIGDWLAIDSEQRDKALTQDFHKEFSQRLSEYAREVYNYASSKKFSYEVVYAGGDDFMALAHPWDIFELLKVLNHTFKCKVNPKATISAGVVIGHEKEDLRYLLRQVRIAEKNAKNKAGRNAFCIRVITRGGAPVEFCAKWDGEGLSILEELVNMFKQEALGDGTVYDLREIYYSNLGKNSEGITKALLKRLMKRRLDTQKLGKDLKVEEFVERLMCSTRSDLDSLVSLFYIARFIAKREDHEVLQNSTL